MSDRLLVTAAVCEDLSGVDGDGLGARRSETAAEAPTEDPRRGIFRPIGLVVRQDVADLPLRRFG